MNQTTSDRFGNTDFNMSDKFDRGGFHNTNLKDKGQQEEQKVYSFENERRD
jgi:hypothetical protein